MEEAIAIKKSNHGANVRRWREWRGINQDVLADKIGVSQATLCGYEKKEKLEKDILEKLAKALDIPIEAITEVNNENPINIFSGTFSDFKDNAAIFNSYPTFNPIDKIAELYERLLLAEKDKVELLQEALRDKK